jgi:hypothetical protein
MITNPVSIGIRLKSKPSHVRRTFLVAPMDKINYGSLFNDDKLLYNFKSYYNRIRL